MDNCKSCLYSNDLENGQVLCDKVILLYGKEVYVESDKVDLPCPSHSSKYIEEIRYMRNNKWLHESEEGEYCEVCRRWVDLDDISQYNFIEVQDKNGKVTGEKMQCKICGEKGRR